MATASFRLPEIDYDLHPLFAPFASGRDPRHDHRINRTFDQIRAAYAGHFRESVLSRAELASDADAPAIHRALIDEGVTAFKTPKPLADAMLRPLNDLLDQLNDNGETEVQGYFIPPTTVDDPKFAPIMGSLLPIARSFVDSLDLMRLASRVLGSRHLVAKATLRETNPAQALFLLDELAAAGSDRSPTVGMHFDVPMNSIKLMVYLEDVREVEQGPFCYIPGSHRRPEGFEDTITRCAVQSLITRPWFSMPGDMMGLAPRDRRRASFGADCLAEDAETEALLAAERRHLAPAGTAILFDTLGVHRGGLVTQSRRRVLQIGIFDNRPLSITPS